ncbi:MAG: CarD family transcriptional regulator [Negativicutes bacterium]|nr:CarD family transcriptional regulator [Negativicutes bacterium]
MLTINTYVVYGTNGVCQITGIKKEKFGGSEKEYYLLKPINTEGSIIYVPLDNALLTSKMRNLLSPDEIHELIKLIPEEQTTWIADSKLRSEKYKDIFGRGDHRELVCMMKSIYLQKKDRSREGKKLWSGDEKALNTAEKILFDEFAIVLNITPEEVVPFIYQELQAGGETNQS